MENLWKGFEARPKDPVLFARLRASLEESGEMDGLIRLYTMRAEVAKPLEAVFLHLAIVEVWSARADDLESAHRAALHVFRCSAALDEATKSAVRGTLEGLLQTREDWRGMALILDAQCDELEEESPRRAALLGKLGALYMETLEDAEAAAPALRDAVLLSPLKSAEQRRALSMLGEGFARDPSNDVLFEALCATFASWVQSPEDAEDAVAWVALRLEHIPEPSADLSLALARLQSTFFEEPHDAVSNATRALDLGAIPEDVLHVFRELHGRFPRHDQVLEGLSSVLQRLKLWGEVMEINATRVAQREDSKEQGVLLRENARIALLELYNPDSACLWLERAWETDSETPRPLLEVARELLAHAPHHTPTHTLFIQVHTDLEEPEPILANLRERLPHTVLPKDRVDLLIHVARVERMLALRPERALSALREAAHVRFDDDPQPLLDELSAMARSGFYRDEVQDLLHEVCARLSLWEPLLNAFQDLLEGAPSAEDRAKMYMDLGHIFEYEIQDYPTALTHYQCAFHDDPTREDALEGGRRIFLEQGDYIMAARLLDLQLQVGHGHTHVAQLFLAKAALHHTHLDDLPRAVEALAHALALGAETPEAMELLGVLVVSQDATLFDALASLEDAWIQADRATDAQDMLWTLSNALWNAPADVLTQDQSQPRACDLELRALRIHNNIRAHERTQDKLLEILTEQTRWEDAAELLSLRAEVASDPATRRTLLSQEALLVHEHLDLPDRVVNLCSTLLEEDPADEKAFRLMLDVFLQNASPQERIDLLTWGLQTAPWAQASEDLDTHAELHTLLMHEQLALDLVDDALAWIHKLSQDQPNHPVLGTFFEHKVQRPQDHLRVLERGLPHLPTRPEQLARHLAIADLCLRESLDVEDTIAHLQAALRLDQELLEEESSGDHVDPQAIREARAHLLGLYTSRAALESQVALLAAEIQDSRTLPERLPSALWEHAEHTLLLDPPDWSAARASLTHRIELTPFEPALRYTLFLWSREHNPPESPETLQALDDLVNALSDANISTVTDHRATQSANLYDLKVQRARVLATQGEFANSADAFCALLREHHDELFSTVDVFHAVSIEHQRAPQLLRHLDAHLSEMSFEEDRVKLLGRMAHIALHDLQDPAQSLALQERALAIQPDNLTILLGVEEALEHAENFDRLAEVLRNHLALVKDPEERSHLWRHISRTHLLADQPAEALSTLHTLLEENPRDIEAHRALLSIHLDRAETTRAVEVIQDLLSLEEDPETRRALHHQRASLTMGTLQDPDRAAELWEELIAEFPEDNVALTQLDEVYTQHQSKAEDLVRIILQRAQHASEEERTPFLLRAASLQHHTLKEPRDAVESLRRILAYNPQQRPALEHLEELYTALEEHAALLETLRVLLQIATSPEDAVARRLHMFALQSGPLETYEEAFQTLQAVHDAYPEEPTHRDLMARHAQAHPALWPAYIASLRGDLIASPPPAHEEVLALLREIARVQSDCVHDLPAAFETHVAIFHMIRPENGPEFSSVVSIAEKEPALYLPLSELYLLVGREAMDPSKTIEFLLEAARIQEEELDAPHAAFATLVEALRVGWSEDTTLALLYGLTHRAGLWEELIALNSERWQEWEDQPDARAEVLFDTAVIWHTQLRERVHALTSLFTAQRIQPHHASSHELLITLLETADEWRQLEEIWETHAQDSAERDDFTQTLTFLERIAALRAERLGDDSAAFDTMMRAFLLDPTRSETRIALHTYADASGRLPEVVLALRDFAARAPAPHALSALLEAAHILDRDLADPQAAVLIVHQARATTPRDPESYRLLEDLLQRLHDHENLVALYSEELTSEADRSTRHRVYSKIAALFEEHDPQRAVAEHLNALRFDPRNPQTLQTLVRLYTRLGDSESTARTLEQLLQTERSVLERIQILHQLTALHIELQRSHRALESAQALLALDPLRLDVFDTIQHLTAQVARPHELLNTLQTRIDQLDHLIREAQEADDMSVEDPSVDPEHLDQTSAVRPPPAPVDPEALERPSAQELLETQHHRLKHAVRIARHELQDNATTLSLLRRLSKRFTHDRDALLLLAEVLEEEGLYEELRATQRALLESATTPQEHIALLQQIARIEDTQLNLPLDAIQTLQSLREHPEHDAFSTLQWIARLQSRAHLWDDALASILAAAHITTDGPPTPPPILAALFLDAAKILEDHLEDPDRAQENYRRAYTILPTNTEARNALIRFAQGAQDWQTHAALLRDEADQHAAPEDRAQTLWTLGNLLRDSSTDPTDALEAYHDALKAQPNSIPILRDLADVAYHHSAWTDAAETYQRLLDGSFARIDLEREALSEAQLLTHESIKDPVFVLYTVRLAFCLEALHRQEEALQSFQHAARLRSTNPAVQLAIGRISFQLNTLDVTNRTLLRLVQTQLDSLTPDECAQTFLLLSKVAVSLKQYKKASDFVHKGLKYAPEHLPSLRYALELAQSQEEHAEAASILGTLLPLTLTESEKIPLLLQRAELQENVLSQPAEALNSYLQITAIQPDHNAAHHHTLRLSIALERWDEASDIAQTLLDQDAALLKSSPHLLEETHFRAQHLNLLAAHADLLSRGLSEHDRALAITEKILALQPDHADALSLTTQILAEQRDLPRLLSFAQTLFDGLPASSIEAKKTLLFRLSQIFGEDPTHDSLTAQLLELALKVDPHQPDLLHTLARLHTKHGDHVESLHALRRLLNLGHFDEPTLRLIYGGQRAAGQDEEAFQTLRLIEFCRCATPEEQQEIRSTRTQPAQLGDNTLGENSITLLHVRHPLAASPVADLMSFALRVFLGHVHQSPTQAGVSQADLIESSRKLNIVNLYKDLRRSADLPPAEVYFSSGSDTPQTLASHPPALLLQDGFLRGMLNREQRFAFARAMETLRTPFVLSNAMDPNEFAGLYDALFERGLGQQLEHPSADAATLRAWHGHLEAYLDEETEHELRHRVSQVARHCTHIPRSEDWVHAVNLSMLRAAMIATADITVVLKRLLREDTSVRTPTVRSCDELASLMESNDFVHEAIQFFLSAEYAAARSALTQPTPPSKDLPDDLYTQRLLTLERQNPTPQPNLVVLLPDLSGKPNPTPSTSTHSYDETQTVVVEALDRSPREERRNHEEDLREEAHAEPLEEIRDLDLEHSEEKISAAFEAPLEDTSDEKKGAAETSDALAFVEGDVEGERDEHNHEAKEVVDRGLSLEGLDVVDVVDVIEVSEDALKTAEHVALTRPVDSADASLQEETVASSGVGEGASQDTQPVALPEALAREDRDEEVEILSAEDIMGDDALIEFLDDEPSPPPPPTPVASPPPLPPPPPKEDPS